MIIVYTCIVGGYDDLIPQPVYEGVRYICFSDSIKGSKYKNWEIMPIPNLETSQPNLINRCLKTLPFTLNFDSNISIYIDGNVLLKLNPHNIVKKFQDSSSAIAAFKHPNRENAKQELSELIRTKKLNDFEIKKAKTLFKNMEDEGYSFTETLTAGYIIMRKHDNELLNSAMKRWLEIILDECKRDQISLQYVLWKYQLEIMYLDDLINPLSFFSRFDHGAYFQFLPKAPQDLLKKIFSKLKNTFHK